MPIRFSGQEGGVGGDGGHKMSSKQDFVTYAEPYYRKSPKGLKTSDNSV